MKFIAFLSSIFISVPVLSAQEIVVTANRLSTALDQVASSVTTIQIDGSILQRERDVADVLREQAGVEIFNQGGAGRVSAIFLRGANSEHTLVLIDGIEANDPMSPTRAFEFGTLSLENIDRIEIVKGPQSVLYGSDGLGGVVNIITKKGSGENKTSVAIEGGSYDSRKLSVGASGQSRKLNYSLSTSRETAGGFSAANEKDGNSEKDGHQRYTLSARVGGAVTEKIDVEGIVRYTDAEADLDGTGGPGGDDLAFRDRSQKLFSRLQGRIFSLGDRLETIAAVNFSRTERENFNDPFLGDTFFQGQQVKTELLNHFHWSETDITSLGVEYEKESGDSDEFSDLSAEAKAVFLQHALRRGGAFVTVGVRVDEHSHGDDPAFTYRLAPGYKFSATTLRGSIGSGIKHPSLFQLFDPNFGNPGLTEEEVVGWDVGIDQKLFGGSSLALTYFESDYSNLISFDPVTFQSVNLGEATIRGLESGVKTGIRDIQFFFQHTHLFEFQSGGDVLIRRPRNSWSIRMNYVLSKAFRVSGDFRHVGRRRDFDATTFERITMPGHEVMSLGGEYEWAQGQSAYVRMQNLLDKSYEEIDGFGTARWSIFLGTKLTL